VAVAAGVGGAALVQKSRDGFPPRGNTLYVFSVNGDTIAAQDVPQASTAAAPAAVTPQ
jgi:alcohol dehydrogenase (cytochrome c)